jgi:hypothetical protein
MQDRRSEARILCSDLVAVEWKDGHGKHRKFMANLEDISPHGACVQLDRPLPLQSKLRLTHPKGILEATVRWCIFREIGYFVGVEFTPGMKWTRKDFRPRHMLDPRKLAQLAAAAALKDDPQQ